MTTDRTCAPARPTAPAERSHAAGRTPSAPADAFSALLGAAAPRADEAPRKPQQREDDAPHHDHAPTRETEDAPAATAPAGEPTTPEAVPAEPTARLVTPEIFALQLASPLPPAVTPAPVAAPVATEPAAATLPAFAPALPAVAAPQTAVPATTEPVAAPAEPISAVPAPAAPAPALPLLTGLTPASAVPADAVALTEPAVATPPQTPAATPAATADVPAEGAVPAPSTPSPFAQSGSDQQPQEQPAAPAAPAAAQAKPAEAPAPAPAATSPISAPAAPAAPMAQAPAGLERAVPLYRAVDTTAMLLHVAAERGVTHARLNLKPVELGGIEVRLQSTPQGVSAQLVADSPEAARMLVQASEDLRRQLSERDVTLLSLDVSTSSEQRHEAAAGGFGADGFGDGYRPGGGFNGRTGAEPAATAPAPAETSLVLPGGVLVDVLA
jgi:hypothetical protein